MIPLLIPPPSLSPPPITHPPPITSSLTPLTLYHPPSHTLSHPPTLSIPLGKPKQGELVNLTMNNSHPLSHLPSPPITSSLTPLTLYHPPSHTLSHPPTLSIPLGKPKQGELVNLTMNNYFGVGVDGAVSLGFHNMRKRVPGWLYPLCSFVSLPLDVAL